MDHIPSIDDLADREYYKLFKWMISKRTFTFSDLKSKYKIEDDKGLTDMVSCMAIMGYLGVKKTNTEYYSDNELISISTKSISNATITATQLLSRYIQKRKYENIRWFTSIILSIFSLVISIVALTTNTSPKKVDVNITSWPSTAETAQQFETISQ